MKMYKRIWLLIYYIREADLSIIYSGNLTINIKSMHFNINKVNAFWMIFGKEVKQILLIIRHTF